MNKHRKFILIKHILHSALYEVPRTWTLEMRRASHEGLNESQCIHGCQITEAEKKGTNAQQ